MLRQLIIDEPYMYVLFRPDEEPLEQFAGRLI